MKCLASVSRAGTDGRTNAQAKRTNLSRLDMKNLLLTLVAATVAMGAQAESNTFGKWFVIGSNDGSAPITLTSNDSGNSFGQICSDEAEGCFWMILSSKTPCQKGEQSPILANSTTGSTSFTAQCVGSFNLGGTQYHRYTISTFDGANSLVTNASGILSFAMPVHGGGFTVMRFDLTGSTRALAHFEKLRASFYKKVNSSSTKDISL